MEVDKVFQEYAQAIKQTELQEIAFTPALEQKIREKIKSRKQKRFRYLFPAVAAAALLAVSFPFIEISPAPHAATRVEHPPVNGLTAAEQKAFDRLKQAIPGLQQYRFDHVEGQFSIRHVIVQKADAQTAQFAVDQETGQLQYFTMGSNTKDTAHREAAPKLAQAKATAFLNAIADDADSYQLKSIGLAYEVVDPNENKSVVVGTSVSFKSKGAASLSRDGDATIRVDAGGNVTGYFRIGQFDRTALEKLYHQVPELSEYSFEYKQAHFGGYSIIFRKNEQAYATIEVDTAEDGRTGRLLGFTMTKAVTDQKQPAVSQAQMTEKAAAFGQYVLEDEFQNYRMQETRKMNDQLSYVRFQRYVNDLQVLGDIWLVTFDRTGSIVEYYRSKESGYKPSEFADPSEAVDLAAAEKELSGHMRLTYRTVPEPILEYTPAASSTWDIDAKTGKIRYTPSSQRAVPSSLVFDESSEAPIQLSVPKKQVLVKNKADALALLMQEFGFDPTGFALRETDERAANKKIYYWESADHKPGKNARVTVDIKTSRVLEISTFRADDKIKVTREEAQREAIRFLAKYIDPEITEVQLSEVIEAGKGNGYTSSGDWGFGFYRSHQGVAITDNQLSDYFVDVDPSTGKANGFYNMSDSRRVEKTSGRDWTIADLPDSKKVVTPQEAAREYLTYYQLQLVYVMKQTNEPGKYVPVLVYRPYQKDAYTNKQIKIDAVTGKAVLK